MHHLYIPISTYKPTSNVHKQFLAKYLLFVQTKQVHAHSVLHKYLKVSKYLFKMCIFWSLQYWIKYSPLKCNSKKLMKNNSRKYLFKEKPTLKAIAMNLKCNGTCLQIFFLHFYDYIHDEMSWWHEY